MMKKAYLLLLAIIPLVFDSCSMCHRNKETKTAICIADNVALRTDPNKTAKVISSISLGETVTFLDETKADSTSGQSGTYIRIKLKDGQEGWALNAYVIVGLRAAAIIEDAAVVYSRPNLLNKTSKTFSKMDIVAVKSEQDGFLEVIGKRNGSKSIQSGWLKASSVVYADVDIAVAKFASKALKITNKQKREEAIQEILNNPDLKSSVFISSLTQPEAPAATEAVVSDSIQD
ncbi:MAG: SH3 domain-containing protein [Bacteroidota bacterium]|nr:SH3 domain-containing protein [Bacteroidota bacterium]